jgi:glycine betaine/choline ABC-type transport system substrate-binding protein
MEQAILFGAINDGMVDLVVVYATDSMLKRYDLVILEDDRGLFPAYNATIIIRNDALANFPELYDVLDLLAGRFTDELMQALNYEVDVVGRSIPDVAREFLQSEGLI